MRKTINQDNVLRYNRQVVLPQLDLDGQETLLNASVLLIGLGGLGCACAQYLVASGVGSLTLVDDDVVDVSNLQRQVLHTEQTVGQPKVSSAMQTLSAMNSETQFELLDARLNDEQMSEQIKRHDIVVDCSDNVETRNQINRLCWQHKIACVSGAAIRIEGQLFTIQPALGGPCYQCISQRFAEQSLSCSETGVLSPVVGIIGASQALLVIKLLANIGESLHGSLTLFDASTMQWQSLKVPANERCTVCSGIQEGIK